MISQNYMFYSKFLESGGILAYPTETIWGLGTNIFCEKSVQEIFNIKNRNSSKIMSILVRDIYMANHYAEISKNLELILEIFWPGPLTIVVKAKNTLPNYIINNDGTVGLRCSCHKWTKNIMNFCTYPIITTSANKSEEPPALSKNDLLWLPNNVTIVDWPETVPANNGSTVIQFEAPNLKILRHGLLKYETLEPVIKTLGFVLIDNAKSI